VKASLALFFMTCLFGCGSFNPFTDGGSGGGSGSTGGGSGSTGGGSGSTGGGSGSTGGSSGSSGGGSGQMCGLSPYVAPAPVANTCAGTPGLGAPVKIAGPGGFSSSGGTGIATGDFDNDGKVDFATTENNQLLLNFGNGDGTFAAALRLRSMKFTIFNVSPVVIADFNGDGKLDVSATGGFGGTSTLFPIIWLNKGNRIFGNANQDNSYDGVDLQGDGIKDNGTASVADLDGDKLADIIYCGYGVKVFMSSCGGISTGTVVNFNNDVNKYTSRNCQILKLNDGDNIPDLVIQSYYFSAYKGRTSILHGNGDGSFSREVVIDNFAEFAIASDVNKDGFVDLVLHNTRQNNEKLGLLKGKADGTFELSSTTVDLTAASYSYPTMIAADFSGDGKVDVVVVDTVLPNVAHLVRGNGDGTFQAPTQFATAIKSNPVMAIADFNNDGLVDLIASDGESTSLSMNRCRP
jgi:hypothetical protein